MSSSCSSSAIELLFVDTSALSPWDELAEIFSLEVFQAIMLTSSSLVSSPALVVSSELACVSDTG